MTDRIDVNHRRQSGPLYYWREGASACHLRQIPT